MTHLRRNRLRSRLSPAAVPLVLFLLSLSPESGPAGPAPSPAGSAGVDTVRFGGTVWDPVDMRWEAVPLAAMRGRTLATLAPVGTTRSAAPKIASQGGIGG
jgi:hypothetical protein